MKSYTEYLVFETRKRKEMVHITDQVETVVRKSGVKDGLCFVSPMHITAAIYVNDLEDEGEARVRASYGDKYQRLSLIKRKFDPDNFFRVNQNIAPAT